MIAAVSHRALLNPARSGPGDLRRGPLSFLKGGRVNKPTESDTYLSFMGSGFETYSWWLKITETANESAAHVGWSAVVVTEDPSKDGELTFTIDHTAITTAIWKILVGAGGEYVSDTC